MNWVNIHYTHLIKQNSARKKISDFDSVCMTLISYNCCSLRFFLSLSAFSVSMLCSWSVNIQLNVAIRIAAMLFHRNPSLLSSTTTAIAVSLTQNIRFGIKTTIKSTDRPTSIDELRFISEKYLFRISITDKSSNNNHHTLKINPSYLLCTHSSRPDFLCSLEPMLFLDIFLWTGCCRCYCADVQIFLCLRIYFEKPTMKRIFINTCIKWIKIKPIARLWTPVVVMHS